MKKTISIVLIICMLFSLFPTAVFAADNTGATQNNPAHFTDVNPSDWYYTTVMEAYEKGWMVGVSDTEFAPNGSATRAMIVTILHRFEGSPKTAQNQFSDVTKDNWYFQSVNWAAENGIVSGIGNGMFGPNQAITREQLAAILMNYAKMKKYDTSITADLLEYADRGNISSWALNSMKWANGKGLINGKDATHLDPTGTATRAEIATILVRFQNLFSKPVKPITGSSGGSSYVTGGSSSNTKPDSGDNTTGDSVGDADAENGICYAISGLELKDGNADLMVNTIDECTLILTVYEEEGSFFQNHKLGKKLFSSKTKVNGALNYEQISVPADVPKNRDMVITAVLVDENGNELHDVYYCLDYTGAYREFQEKTIYDFEDQNQVVNLDEEIDNNFVVFRSDVKVFRESAQKNRVVTSSAYSITFADPDENVSNAKKGDRVAIALADDNVIVVVVSEVVTNDDGIQIIYEEADSIIEDYVFVKIETDVAANGVQSGDEVEYDTVQYSYAASGARSIPDINLNPDITSKIKLEQDLKLSDNTTLSISGVGNITVHIKIFYDKVLLGADYLEIGITEDAKATFTLNLLTGVDGSKPGKDEANQDSMGDKLEKEFSFVGNFQTNIPLVEIEGGMKIPVKLLLGVGFSSTVELKDTTGFSYKRFEGEKSDKQKIKKNEINITALNAEGSFSPEIALKPFAGFNILAGAVKPNINGQYGFKGSCKVSSPALTVAQNASEKHDCYACVSASVKDYASVGLELKIKWDADEKYKTAFSWDMVSKENIFLPKDWKCYFSVDNLEFGVGSCPHKSYRTTVATRDGAGNAVNGLSVKVFSAENSGPEYTPNDMHYWYLPKGSYTAFTSYNGHNYQQDFEVDTKSDGYIANGEIRVVITIDGAETNPGTPEQPGDNNPSINPDSEYDYEIIIDMSEAPDYNYVDWLLPEGLSGLYTYDAQLLNQPAQSPIVGVYPNYYSEKTRGPILDATDLLNGNHVAAQPSLSSTYWANYMKQESALLKDNLRGRNFVGYPTSVESNNETWKLNVRAADQITCKEFENDWAYAFYVNKAYMISVWDSTHSAKVWIGIKKVADATDQYVPTKLPGIDWDEKIVINNIDGGKYENFDIVLPEMEEGIEYLTEVYEYSPIYGYVSSYPESARDIYNIDFEESRAILGSAIKWDYEVDGSIAVREAYFDAIAKEFADYAKDYVLQNTDRLSENVYGRNGNINIPYSKFLTEVVEGRDGKRIWMTPEPLPAPYVKVDLRDSAGKEVSLRIVGLGQGTVFSFHNALHDYFYITGDEGDYSDVSVYIRIKRLGEKTEVNETIKQLFPEYEIVYSPFNNL